MLTPIQRLQRGPSINVLCFISRRQHLDQLWSQKTRWPNAGLMLGRLRRRCASNNLTCRGCWGACSVCAAVWRVRSRPRSCISMLYIHYKPMQLPWKDKRQHLLTLQVSRYCVLALQSVLWLYTYIKQFQDISCLGDIPCYVRERLYGNARQKQQTMQKSNKFDQTQAI